jgi:hypothetical protein
LQPTVTAAQTGQIEVGRAPILWLGYLRGVPRERCPRLNRQPLGRMAGMK